MSLPSKDMMAAIATTRFGLGARPGEIATAGADPQGWLLEQIRPTGADTPQDDGVSSAVRYVAMEANRRERDTTRKAVINSDRKDTAALARLKDAQSLLRDTIADDFMARARLATNTPASFRERWSLFWANHFTVSATKATTSTLVGPFEREAIRPHVFGRFEDMLVAVSTHPAMLTYLDQTKSVGPNSRAAERVTRRQPGKRNPGLNENLAREILELHTLGVGSGYTQADVTEFARGLTGFSLAGVQDERAGEFVFRDITHEPGIRTIMGRKYPEDGLEQGLAVLKAVAADPRTAHHVCTKIARHFVADAPPPSLVAALEKRWIETGGQLDAVAQTLATSDEAWNPTAAKFKTPYEFTLSAWRLTGGEPSGIARIGPILTGLGQKPFSPPSPKGWPEEAQAWASPDGLVKRMQWSQTFAAAVADQRDPNNAAMEALGARLTPPVAQAVRRAETRREAFALLLMSPEFQRR